MSDFDAQLRAAGMSADESAKKSALLEELTRKLRDVRGGALEKTCAFFVPGRIEVLGKHTDYAGGRSIVCAIERGICVVAAPRADSSMRVIDFANNLEACVALDHGEEVLRGHWSNYVATVARRFSRDFPFARTGADIIFASDLPAAAGMSSSSALIIAIFMALADVNSLAIVDSIRRDDRGREELAAYVSAVESGAEFGTSTATAGVGTLGGSEDHVAIFCSRAGKLRQYSYCPVRLEKEIPVPPEYSFVIAVSGVKADKTGNALDSYNRISLAARKILELWRSATGSGDASLAGALASEPEAGERLHRILCESSDQEYSVEILLDRLDQFAKESNEIIPSAGESFARGDMGTFGGLADRSQSLAEKLLGNQTRETIQLARSARKLGAVAASAFVAGFGGSVWALVASGSAEDFCANWAASYRQTFPERAEVCEFFATRTGPGLIRFQL